jgi:hypothetical protein
MTRPEKAQLDEVFIEMVIDAGMAFSVVENSTVKASAAKLRPAYTMPTRRDVSTHTTRNV